MAKAFGSRKVRGMKANPAASLTKRDRNSTQENDGVAPYAFIGRTLHQFGLSNSRDTVQTFKGNEAGGFAPASVG
jgi:hypothetical protein